jgi:hypothetical protein
MSLTRRSEPPRADRLLKRQKISVQLSHEAAASDETHEFRGFLPFQCNMVEISDSLWPRDARDQLSAIAGRRAPAELLVLPTGHSELHNMNKNGCPSLSPFGVQIDVHANVRELVYAMPRI